MYRPGGFPEFSPKDQYTFDEILRVVHTIFSRYNYHRIWTPAVESTEVLLKGGDVAEQQIYGLFGLAQGIEDVKEYALHFDLTIPFARYVLDHRNELTFPFSRCQMQPVWRGERTKRGRFKEFRQMDVDTVWPSETNVGTRYDVQSVKVMDQVMKTLCRHFEVSINFVAKISHLGLTKAYLNSLGLDAEQCKLTIKVLDNYFKRPHAESMQVLDDSIGKEHREKIEYIIQTKDYSSMAGLYGYGDLVEILTKLSALGAICEYDICIVRGQNYYSGMVVERLNRDDVEFGSLAGGGRYDNLTAFIDPKQSFSGVGTSLGRFMYMVLEKCTKSFMPPSYLFINFEDTQKETLDLYGRFLQGGLPCAMYPTAAKLGKQFEYADRSGFAYCVVYGAGEKEQNIFKLKNMKTGEEKAYQIHHAAGCIVFCDKKVLLVKNHDGWRGFPKGHSEAGESLEQTMKRELLEETGISEYIPLSDKVFTHTYFFDTGDVRKTVLYKVIKVDIPDITLQSEELETYKWCTYEEADMKLASSTRLVLSQVKDFFA